MYKYKQRYICILVLPSESAYVISGSFYICCSLMSAGHTKPHHLFTENVLPRSALLSKEEVKVCL